MISLHIALVLSANVNMMFIIVIVTLKQPWIIKEWTLIIQDAQKGKKIKERKEKTMVDIEIKYAAPQREQRADRPPRKNNQQQQQQQRKSEGRGNQAKPAGAKPSGPKVNVADVKAFPSLG